MTRAPATSATFRGRANRRRSGVVANAESAPGGPVEGLSSSASVTMRTAIPGCSGASINDVQDFLLGPVGQSGSVYLVVAPAPRGGLGRAVPHGARAVPVRGFAPSSFRVEGPRYGVRGVVDRVQRTASALDALWRQGVLEGSRRMHRAAHAAGHQESCQNPHRCPLVVCRESYGDWVTEAGTIERRIRWSG